MYKQMYEEAKFNNDQRLRRDRMIHENSQSDRDEYLRRQRERCAQLELDVISTLIVAEVISSSDSNDSGGSSCD